MENETQIFSGDSKIITTVLSIRRKPIFHLPNDDPKRGIVKIGSAYAKNSKYPLRGLSFEEEKVFLPELIGISPKDVAWRASASEYWSNISVAIPDDGEGIVDGFAGKILRFTVEIFGEKNVKKYKDASLEEKARLLSKWCLGEKPVARLLEGTEDYVLFRYCLVYSRVANHIEDAYKSPKIQFFLYSKEEENKKKKEELTSYLEATKLLFEILQNEDSIDSVIRMYGEYPNDASMFPTSADKQIFIKEKSESNPTLFVSFANDKNLKVKAKIKEAIEYGIIKNPANTETYYYGDNNEFLLGKTLDDAILYLISTDPSKAKVRDQILSQLKSKQV